MAKRNRGRTPVPTPRRGGRRWLFILVVAAAAGAWWLVSRPSTPPPQGATEAASFEPTRQNSGESARLAPAGMVWIPGGEFSMGAAEPMGGDANAVGMQATADSRPIHRVYVDGFWMDATEVTNAQFAAFVAATGYVTIAEQTPRAEDFPGALPENLVAGSIVFAPPDHPVSLDDHLAWWSYVKGASWRHPLYRR